MARRPFDPSAHGGAKTTYQQGNIFDGRRSRAGRRRRCGRPPCVHHHGVAEESARVNLAGSRNVFEATVAAERPRRLVYTSSVAADGYHSDNPVPITEDVAPRPADTTTPNRKPRARQRWPRSPRELAGGVHPSSVHRAGPQGARARGHDAVAAVAQRRAPATRALPCSKPVPDPGFPLQLVHHDDVAAAVALAASADAAPGAYNIAGDGEVSISDIVTALGGRPVRGSSRRRDRRVGGHRERAVHSVGPGVAARRAGVGRDGHQQGEVAVGLEAEVHVGGNAAGPRGGCLKRRGVSFGSPVRVTTPDYAAC